VSLPPEILTAIGRAVERQGGDLDDALDLASVWERLAADPHGRLARLRHDAANPGCSCADGGSLDSAGHCERCYRVHV
jgi:hypothetical protein